MDRELLRLLLHLAKAGRVNLVQLARDLGWSRSRVYKVLLWRQRAPHPEEVEEVLSLLGLYPSDVRTSVSLTADQLSDAVRKLRLDLDSEDLVVGVGVDDAARLSGAPQFRWVDGRLRLAGREL